MEYASDQLLTVLSQFNPWWRNESIPDVPAWRRAVFTELWTWMETPPAPRAVLISGARQVGKTTVMLQVIQKLLDQGTPPGNILYATFDHPILKLSKLDAVLRAWRERETRAPGPEYVFLDEIQFVAEWGTWIKHQVDFQKGRRIAFTGSAMPLLESDQESGVGRWHTIRVSTLSFYEYVQLKHIKLPALPKVTSLTELFGWDARAWQRVVHDAEGYVGHFHEYLLRGGFPQAALVESVTQAQRLLREDIVEKILKRDMTALFGVRRIMELEFVFIYLCMHGGAMLDQSKLCSQLGVTRETALRFIAHLESTGLIYRLQPLGYGKQVLRGQFKVYLTDAAIAPAVMLRGRAMLDDAAALGIATETTVLKHLYTRYYKHDVKFSYWRGKRDVEVDVVASLNGQLIPFEVKYREQHTGARVLEGLLSFCESNEVSRGYVVTKNLDDFGLVTLPSSRTKIFAKLLRIPATLLCYWMGESEIHDAEFSA